MTNLTEQESHFAFGDNWREFAEKIDARRVAQSDEGLAKLLKPEELQGRSVIDIGCGSGLPALSMLRAGASHVTCVDIDPASVEAARQTLGALAKPGQWSAGVASVFELTGAYDVVYSWGVLHHTGDMWRAVDRAASCVRPGGLLAIALYFKTPLCGLWRAEKRLYSRGPKFVQALLRGLYYGAFFALKVVKGRNPLAYLRDYHKRGMNWRHDVHDWMGGYPYESATPEEVRAFLTSRGFELVRQNLAPGDRFGLSGSGCDEFVFRRA